MLIVGDVRLSDEGVSVFEAVDATSIELRLVTSRAVIEATLKHAGFEATVSPAGEAASRIVKQMGGLWNCRPLRLPGLRKLVSSGAKLWTWRDALRQLHDDGTYSLYRNVKPAQEQLRSLIERGALQPVLALTCPICSVTSPYRLDELGTRMTCPRCSHAFDPAPLLESSMWKYRPSGFFVTMSTHGSLPVILTMLRILETADRDHLLLDSSQQLKATDGDVEVDCVALWRTRGGAPAVAIGECKGGDREITSSDISDLQQSG